MAIIRDFPVRHIVYLRTTCENIPKSTRMGYILIAMQKIPKMLQKFQNSFIEDSMLKAIEKSEKSRQMWLQQTIFLYLNTVS